MTSEHLANLEKDCAKRFGRSIGYEVEIVRAAKLFEDVTGYEAFSSRVEAAPMALQIQMPEVPNWLSDSFTELARLDVARQPAQSYVSRDPSFMVNLLALLTEGITRGTVVQ